MICLLFSVLDPVVGDVFSVLWEPEMISETGSAFADHDCPHPHSDRADSAGGHSHNSPRDNPTMAYQYACFSFLASILAAHFVPPLLNETGAFN